jgi:hypothetical protein
MEGGTGQSSRISLFSSAASASATPAYCQRGQQFGKDEATLQRSPESVAFEECRPNKPIQTIPVQLGDLGHRGLFPLGGSGGRTTTDDDDEEQIRTLRATGCFDLRSSDRRHHRRVYRPNLLSLMGVFHYLLFIDSLLNSEGNTSVEDLFGFCGMKMWGTRQEPRAIDAAYPSGGDDDATGHQQ